MFFSRWLRRLRFRLNSLIVILLGIIAVVVIFSSAGARDETGIIRQIVKGFRETVSQTFQEGLYFSSFGGGESSENGTEGDAGSGENQFLSLPPFGYEDIPEYAGKPSADVNEGVPFFAADIPAEGEHYEDLDAYGRARGAQIVVGPETLPTEERGDISKIHPSGWHNARYEGIGNGDFLWNRCHCLGFQLGGNDDERNLITGSRYLNVEGMLANENAVASYVRETGNHVAYRVTPIYKGQEAVCRGVLMEAVSIEDPAIRICEFCFNVQPGVRIDYETGYSEKE